METRGRKADKVRKGKKEVFQPRATREQGKASQEAQFFKECILEEIKQEIEEVGHGLWEDFDALKPIEEFVEPPD